MAGIGTMVDIPASKHTVSVSIIDTTVRFKRWEIDPFVQEPKIAGHTHMTVPSWAFKIVHPERGTYLYDLGVRLDYNDKLPTRSLDLMKKNGWNIDIEKDVAQILSGNGEKLEHVNGIIWSHWHWDHIGDPTTFPSGTKVVVGPGFKSAMLPGFPENPDGAVNSDAWENRELEEVEMSQDLIVGGYPALDYFGDGSFYLLYSAGHTVGHLSALARTTPGPDPSFIFMGGDISHVIGQFRPNMYAPLPDKISPDPRKPLDRHFQSFCPCEGYIAIHPQRARDKPYYKGARGMAFDFDKAEASLQKLEAFDADERVLIVIAHDASLLDIVDVYPAEANQWRQKDWKKLAHWRFLGDFKPE
ncbi:MAG: hypothetical protein GOMPHAMPRED_007864 [Gomphillus americanus]|uniref:Metallo-beta-lactamase domain-containing protein n=1 Tax=Gomphillus americanus TaxID=1940652 RepID=A0A8H3I382_9LECA|nr:MAG: hypothetical protein GOMPHAMPRED_007864 [Gomphillus americanus]